MDSKNELLDLIILGAGRQEPVSCNKLALITAAGLYGIYAANTYLTLHPTANIKVLDSDTDVGGVWSRSRLYPGFWSQTGARLSGFPDVPFTVPDDAPRYHDLCEAKYLAQYLEDYVTNNVHDGRSLRERFIFECWVHNVVKDGDVWCVRARLEETDVEYRSRKVIVATGQNSIPKVPHLPGSDSFHGSIIHQKDFGRSAILTADESKLHEHTNITVLGGSKSASDIVYAAATDPNCARKVTWIIRNSGAGPLLMSKANGFGKYKSLPELGSIRALAGLSSANPFLEESWWGWFLHKTWLGERLLDWIWRSSEKGSHAIANYHGREKALPGFENLESTTRLRWRTGHIGLLQKDDFWDVVATNVQIYRGDVVRMEEDAVVLDDGTRVETDVLLCATGWKQEYSFFSLAEAARLGLPLPLGETSFVGESDCHWSRMEAEADGRVLQRWPYLAQTTSYKQQDRNTTPYRLHNFTIPPADHSIAFLGVPMVPNSYHTAIAQTLYAIGVLDSTIALPSHAQMEEEIAFINAWCARRYPVHGWKGNVIDYEMTSFTDHLLETLALGSHRNKGRWWSDLTDPCLASDYAGLVDEYRRRYMGVKE